MKKVLGFIRRFPLTSYGLLAVIIIIITAIQKDYSDSIPLMLLALPIFVIYGKICDLVCWCVLSNYKDILLMFFPTLITLILLDLLLLYLRKNLIPIIRSKLKSKSQSKPKND